MTIKIDKELYKQAQEYYRQWNEEKAEDRVTSAASLTPAELWHKYEALWKFGWRLSPNPHDWAWQEKAQALDAYYDRVQQLEKWRRVRGQRT